MYITITAVTLLFLTLKKFKQLFDYMDSKMLDEKYLKIDDQGLEVF